MGMYTEIIFGACLKKDTPEQVVAIIEDMVNGVDVSGNFPDHPFFRSDRSWLLHSGGSYYFPGVVPPQFTFDEIDDRWRLHFRTNIKNYDSEIEKFLDWIKPYIEDGSGSRNMYAIVIYEEGLPQIYYLDEEE